MRRRRQGEERDGQEAGAGKGWVGTREGRLTEEGQAAEKGDAGVGDERVKIRPTDRGEEEPGANRGRRSRGRAGRGTEREGKAGREPRRTEGLHWGRCRKAAASCQEWGSRALTALLPQEHQLEFPQRVPEVSARGHDGAGGATATSAQRPPGPTLLQPVDEKGKRKGRRRAFSAPAGPGGGARLGGRTPLHRQATVAAASPQCRLAPSEARGWVAKEGGVRRQRCARGSQS